MTIPNGFHDWCAEQGVSPFHPSEWSPLTHGAFVAWKVAKFRERWRAAIRNGDVDATRRQQGRAYLIRRVQDDLAGALATAPSDVYRACPCHPSPAWPSPTKDTNGPRTAAECVAWLTATFALRSRSQGAA